jgi:F-type H+-transporting ATPase subunit b
MGFAEKISSFVNEALGVAPEEMIIQIVSTIILFLIVRFFFWNKVTDYLEARKQEMEENYQRAKEDKEAAVELKVAAEKELVEIKKGANEKYANAKARGEEKRKEIVEEAKQEASQIIDNANKEIKNMVEKAKIDINDEIVSVATLMAEKIIEKEIDPEKHKDLIKKATKEVVN